MMKGQGMYSEVLLFMMSTAKGRETDKINPPLVAAIYKSCNTYLGSTTEVFSKLSVQGNIWALEFKDYILSLHFKNISK